MRIIAVGALLAVSFFGYWGFIPGISNLFGSNTPRDLDAEVTEIDGISALEKLGQKIVDPEDDPHAQLVEAGGIKVKTTLTQEEFAAHVVKIHPISDVQIRLEGDTLEMSGKIDRARIPQFLKTIGIDDGRSGSEILGIINRYLPVDPTFYIKGSGSVEKDIPDFTVEKAEVGKISIDHMQAERAAEEYVELMLRQVPGFVADYVTVQDGELIFQGSAARRVPRY